MAILIITSAISVLFLTFKQYTNEKAKTSDFNYSLPIEIFNRIKLENNSSGQVIVNDNITCYYKSYIEEKGNLTFSIENKKQVELLRYVVSCGNNIKYTFFIIRTTSQIGN